MGVVSTAPPGAHASTPGVKTSPVLQQVGTDALNASGLWGPDTRVQRPQGLQCWTPGLWAGHQVKWALPGTSTSSSLGIKGSKSLCPTLDWPQTLTGGSEQGRALPLSSARNKAKQATESKPLASRHPPPHLPSPGAKQPFPVWGRTKSQALPSSTDV